MKKLKFILSLSLLMTLVFSSCVKEDTTPDLASTPISEVSEADFPEWIAQFADKEVQVEYATVEEINAVMIEHGLEPFTDEDVEEAAQYRTTFPCISWNFLGDYNNNGYLSTLDIVFAQQYLCSTVGCYGTLPVNGSSPESAQNFALLSFLHTGNFSTASVLNYSGDSHAARQFILGHIACN